MCSDCEVSGWLWYLISWEFWHIQGSNLMAPRGLGGEICSRFEESMSSLVVFIISIIYIWLLVVNIISSSNFRINCNQIIMFWKLIYINYKSTIGQQFWRSVTPSNIKRNMRFICFICDLKKGEMTSKSIWRPSSSFSPLGQLPVALYRWKCICRAAVAPMSGTYC